jgi:hypothetical protein
MQTLRNMLGSVKARAEAESKKKIPESAEASVKSFHDKERDRMSKDPENKGYQRAVEVANAKANKFMAAVRDASHPDHEQAYSLYKNGYDLNQKRAEADILAKTCSEMGEAKFCKKDPAYEANICKLYQPTGNVGLDQQAFFAAFKSKMQAKWHASGYAKDAAAVEELAEKYNLKRNDSLIDLQSFQPKD